MSFGNLKKWRHKIHIRFGLIFSLTFLISALILFSVVLFSLYTTLINSDEDFANTRLIGYWAKYQRGGINGLLEQLRIELEVSSEKAYLVRIEDNKGDTFFISMPGSWEGMDLSTFQSTGAASIEHYLHLPLKFQKLSFLVRGVGLSDGYTIQVAVDMRWRGEFLHRFQGSFLALLGLMVLLCFATGVLVTTRAMRPLKSLNKQINTIIATGQIHGRIPYMHTGDQLDELSGRYNQMMERIDQLLTGMRETLDNAAHDIRTPLTSLRGAAELALKNPEEEQMREALESSVEQADRILIMLNTLLEISAAENRLDITNPVDLPEIVTQVMELYRFVADDREILLETRLDPVPLIMGTPGKLRQAIGNLVDNALKYSPPGSRVRISTSYETSSSTNDTNDTKMVIFRISDQGPGIPSTELDLIWRRLYRGDHNRSTPGLGLGLSLVKAVAEAMDGTAAVENRLDGCDFILRFPAVNL